MARERIESLITDLHDQLAGPDCSPQQQQLLNQVKEHMHHWNDPEPVDPGFKETLEQLVADVEVTHPKAVRVVHEILDALANMGI